MKKSKILKTQVRIITKKIALRAGPVRKGEPISYPVFDEKTGTWKQEHLTVPVKPRKGK